MTPFDGAVSLPVVVVRKSSKKPRPPRAPKAGSLGATAAEVYQLAASILAIRDRFDRETGRLRKLIASAELTAKHPGAELGKRAISNLVHWRRGLGNLDAHRERFETQIVIEPRLAVDEVDAIQPNQHFSPPPLTKNAVRDLRLKRAVEEAYAWLRYQDHRDPGDGLDRHPKYKSAFASVASEPERVLRAVATVATATMAPKVASMSGLHRLAQHRAVRERLESSADGHKRAAEVLVALISGIGEQTVKRAAGS